MDERIKKLLIWIAHNMEPEPMSGWFPGGPYWNVSVVSLLDQIAEEFDLTKGDVAEVVNGERESIESSMSTIEQKGESK